MDLLRQSYLYQGLPAFEESCRKFERDDLTLCPEWIAGCVPMKLGCVISSEIAYCKIPEYPEKGESWDAVVRAALDSIEMYESNIGIRGE